METFLGGDTLPRQLISRLNASDTRLLAGETEQLTVPYVRVEGTSERYSYFPASEELPLSGLWHDPALFSDAGKGQTALQFKPKEPPKAPAQSSRISLPPDPSGLPMTPPRPLSLSEQQVRTAPRAAMQYAAEDISVYPGGIPMENVVDLQEKALFKSFEQLSQDSIVENLMLDAVRPGFKRGVIQQLQQPTNKQWREQRRAEAIAAKNEEKPVDPAGQPKKTEGAATTSGKRVTFDLPSSSPQEKISEAKESESRLEQLTERLQQIRCAHQTQETQKKAIVSGVSQGPPSDAPPKGTHEFVGDTFVNELISRCSLKLRTLNGGMKVSSVEPKPRNSTVAPKEMTRPSRLLKDIEAVEVRRKQRDGNKLGAHGFRSRQHHEDATLYLPQPTEESISIRCSKGMQGLRALRGRPRIRSPPSMPKADLLCLSKSLLPASQDADAGSFISEEEAVERMHDNAPDSIDRPSYEVYHTTPTPPEDLVDATPSLEELSRNFVPTTGYPHDANNNTNYPAAIPAFVSRLSKSQDSRMSVPPAAAVLYAIPKESEACSIVEAMPTDPRSGASQITEAALANMSAKEIRNVEELVAGGFVALQRQTHKLDYRNPWEDEKLHLKMIVNEPIHSRDPLFTERQNQLLNKWKYPANEISPGYYIKEASLEDIRQAILANKKQRSIFDLQSKWRPLQECEIMAVAAQMQADWSR